MRNSAAGKLVLLSILLRLLFASLVVALPSDDNKLKKKEVKIYKASRAYSFVRYSENKIFQPDSSALSHFYNALDSLQNGTRQKVNVIHIGDSHIQADLFSGRVRSLLQDSAVFGNGGRGLIFPYT